MARRTTGTGKAQQETGKAARDTGASRQQAGSHAGLLLAARPFAVFLLIVIAMGVIYIVGSRLSLDEARAQQATDARLGFIAPDVALSDMTGQAVSLASYRGQAVLLNLWASWCDPCRDEMPAIERVYQRYRAEGFSVLAVNITYDDDEGDARAFVKQQGLSFPVLLDRDGRVSKAYRLVTLPTSYFIGRDGAIRDIAVGGLTEAMLEVRVKRLLAGGR